MNYETVISAAELKQLIASKRPYRLFDCTSTPPTQAAREEYLSEHIPGAVHAPLETVLCEKSQGHMEPLPSGGRHPLPHRQQFARWLSEIGFENTMQAVVYDRNGMHYCGRLWWMLKWLGHNNVAVLDGGLQAWASEGPMAAGDEPLQNTANFTLNPSLMRLVSSTDVLSGLGLSSQTLIDARSAPRFRGETEPLDPVAGHIPGALNRPFTQNFETPGFFKPPEVLRREFDSLLDGRDASSVVHHCGSGVTAIPNLLAMQIAGLGVTGLYAGSWSEWCTNSMRPVALG